MPANRPAILVASLLMLASSAATRATQDAATEASAPRAVVANATHDFGQVVTGTVLRHRFEIRNEGGAPLHINEVRPGMGVVIRSYDPVIAPGAVGGVEIEMDGLKITGAGSGRIGLLTNDPAQEMVALEARFDVQPAIQVKPGYARWIYVQHEPVGTIKELVWAKDGRPFQVLAVESEQPGIRTSFRQATPEERDPAVAGSQWKVELSLAADAPVGAIAGMAVVRTDHPTQKLVPIPLSGFVRPRYFLEPARGEARPPVPGNLGKLTLAEPRTLNYSLRNFATPPVEVVGAETDIAGVTAAVSALEPGRVFNVALRLDPATMQPGAFTGKLVVRLSDPLQPAVELPLSGELVAAAPTAGR
jgi:hypothetical protein